MHPSSLGLLGRLVIVGLLQVLAVSASWGQATAGGGPPPSPLPRLGQQTASIRVTTRVVQVSVNAVDKDGNAVTDLTEGDFRLFDEGQTQQISHFFKRVTALNLSATLAGRANFFSNRLTQGENSTALTVILLDSVNTPSTDFGQAQNQVADFVQRVQPQDRVALYGVTYTKLYVLHDFTNDPSALLRALGRAPKQENLGPSASPPPDSNTGEKEADAFIAAANARTAAAYSLNRVEQTTAAMEAIAGRLAKYPGRKNLIWVSSNFPYRMGGRVGEDVSKAMQAMSNASVAVYPVDARGLVAPKGGDSFSLPDVDTMVVLAQGTGGRAFYNTNDISGSIRQAVEDSHVSYTLSYNPSHNQWDGRFRKIKVEVSRPGVRLRYRGGYFATAEGSPDQKEKKLTLMDAARSPLGLDDIGLDVQVAAEAGPSLVKLRAEVRVDPAELVFARNGKHWTDNIEAIWLELGPDGRTLASTGQTLKLNLPLDGYEKVQRDGLTFKESITVRSGTVEVRLAVRDVNTRAMGSLTIPLGALVNTQRDQER